MTTSPVRPLLLLTAATAVLSASILLLFGDDNPSGGMSTWLREARRREHLGGTREELLRSVKTTRNIVDALAEGRMELRQAASALREERERRPHVVLPPPSSFSEEAIEEYYLRSAVAEARSSLEGQPREYKVMQRLERELRICLEKLPHHSPAEIPPLATP